MVGNRVGRLSVEKIAGRRGASFQCRCDCGNTIVLPRSSLATLHNTSCGCGIGHRSRKHGFASGIYATNRHRFYRIWDGLRKRTSVPTNHNYPNYGGRGIKSEWTTFNEFFLDMFASYLGHVEKYGEANTTLDRINNDANYSASNCRWSTLKEQAQNRRTNRYVTFNGKRLSCSQFCEAYGVERKWFYNQLRHHSFEEILIRLGL
jgi:hypothetical protein